MNLRQSVTYTLLLLALLPSCVPGSAPLAPKNTESVAPLSGDYIVIDTSKRTLTVFMKDKAVKTFDRIALGSAGAGYKALKGDDITPLGRFSIASIRPSEKYKYFIGLSYPSIDYAQKALNDKRIDESTFKAIKGAIETSKTPPQNTSLGGNIGIHGLGMGSIEIHHIAVWTRGCVALDNTQIKDLVAIIRPGMAVDIRS